MQTFERWFPVDEVPEFLAGVFVLQHTGGGVTLLCDAEFPNGRLLVLRFESLEAIIMQREFSDCWPSEWITSPPPKSPGSHWAFPFLVAKNSRWAQGSMQARRYGVEPRHYCVLSGTDFVDVLSLEPPTVSWATAEQIEAAIAAAGKLGEA